MADALLTITAFAVAYFAFALLALSQERHWFSVSRNLDAAHPSEAALRRWRCAGGTGLAAACALCLSVHGASFGGLLSVVMLGACAIAVALTLAWTPHWLRFITRMPAA